RAVTSWWGILYGARGHGGKERRGASRARRNSLIRVTGRRPGRNRSGSTGRITGRRWTPASPGAGTRWGTPARILKALRTRCVSPGPHPPENQESGPAMRVYVPLTLPGLAKAHESGELGDGPLVAYAVTPALRE